MSFVPFVRFGAHVGRTLSSLQSQAIQRGYIGRQRDAYKALGDGYKKYLARQGLSVNPDRWQAEGYGGKYDRFNSGYQASQWNSASTAFGGLDRGTGMATWL